MRPPRHLRDEAREYWTKHFDRLVGEGVVTPDRDTEGFALLCDVWRILRNTDPMLDSKDALRFVSLLKQYQSLAKQYGLMPAARRASGVGEPTDITDALRRLTGGA